jgi:hypothetical protein
MKRLLSVFIFTTLFFNLFAQDRIFNYVYQTNVLNKGQKEIEVWNTFSWGKVDFYREFSHRLEFEIGLNKRLQTAFYLNVSSESEYFIGKKLVLNGPTVNEINDTSIITSNEFSFSSEWKYKLSDPVADVIGSGLYAEISVGTEEIEFEGKLLLDKKMNKFITALNLVAEYEIETELEEGEVENEKEFAAKINYGLSYQLAKNVHFGLEASCINGFHDGSIEHSVLYAGPVLSVLRENFWINLTFFPQVTAFKGATYNGLDLDHHTKYETRILFSYVF